MKYSRVVSRAVVFLLCRMKIFIFNEKQEKYTVMLMLGHGPKESIRFYIPKV